MQLRAHHRSCARSTLARGARRTLLALAVFGFAAACYPELAPSEAPAADGSGGGGAQPSEGGGGTIATEAGATSGGGDAGPVCGDGVLQEPEECDDSNKRSRDGCSARCLSEPDAEGACGDGKVSPGEDCDDGNLQPGDGCNRLCKLEECGNSTLDAGEECDPPQAGSCTETCKVTSGNCGDAELQADELEQCDDGNATAGDGCHDCRLECGDARIDAELGEECEPEYSEHCSEDCRWLPACGDGEVQAVAGEQCDPSNGVTCVECKTVVPPPPPSECNGGAGSGGPLGQAGDCGSPVECVPRTSSERVQNGSFQSSAAGWAAHDPAIRLQGVAEGSPEPMALEVAFDAGPVRAMSGAFQCIAVRPGTRYELRAQYRIPAAAPEGVLAAVTALLYAGTRCSGPYIEPPRSGPAGGVRDGWTPYQMALDTTALQTAGASEGRLLLRLNVVRPAEVQGSRVLWDSVSLTELGSTCGNCTIDAGESCDDGNRASGDGCSAICQREQGMPCGDGELQPPEECDDGNTVFGAPGDHCTPSCRTSSPCDECAGGVLCATDLDACLGLAGRAAAGPARGAPRSALCDRLRSCVHESACDRVSRNTNGVEGAFLENCYCGSAADCFGDADQANGSCRAEIEAALETTEPASILQRFDDTDPRFPVFAALRALRECEALSCSAECDAPLECGDGRVQDRNFEFVFNIDRKDVPCSDDLTHTGFGCSFEECDDGNDLLGDGCDDNCFVEACGNNVTQEAAGEECDDGNTASGDGCSAECQNEYVCGNSMLELPFEECDPPQADAGRVCSEAEYTADATQCRCDTACQRTVCGNGIVQRPAEQCDPPDDISCGTDCQLLDQGICETCINENDDLRPFNEEVCNVDAACIAVKKCVIEAGCFLPVAASCYCGENVGDCEGPDFVPQGPCAEVIRAGIGTDEPDNEEVLVRFFAVEYASGVAMSVVDEASRVCTRECFQLAP